MKVIQWFQRRSSKNLGQLDIFVTQMRPTKTKKKTPQKLLNKKLTHTKTHAQSIYNSLFIEKQPCCSSMIKTKEMIFKNNKSQLIDSVLPVLDDGIVILSHFQRHKRLFVSLRYVNKYNKTMWEEYYDSRIAKIAISRPNEVILCQPKQKIMTIVELETKNRIKIEFPLQMKEVDFFVFGESGYIAITRLPQFNRSFSIVLYYNYESFKKGGQYLAKNDQIFKYGNIRKIDNFSKLGWADFNNNILSLHIINYDKYQKQIIREKIITLNTLQACFGPSIEENMICRQIIQMSSYRYLIIAQASHGARIVTDGEKYPFFANTFIVNTRKGNFKAYIQPFEELPQKLTGYHFSCYLLGRWIVYYFKENDIPVDQRASPEINKMKAYYVYSEGSGQSLLQNDCICKKYNSPDWNQDMIVESVLIPSKMNKGEKLVEAIRLRTFFPLNIVYLFFLLQLNQDFDDDLLQDSIQMLVPL